MAVPLLGFTVPGTASATRAAAPDVVQASLAAGWIYWATYRDVASCVYTGDLLAYPGSPIYAAYYCEEGYSTIGNYFYYELFLYKKF
ncbi:hypothetical protein DMB66_10505 [Actinoplanes sp. ATCC 53533]|nr:hypothetical protein DMB66_10505 [Actinoplanes sp. ATCC 53533]